MFYRVVRYIVGKPISAMYRYRIEGREHLPRDGGYILAPSHRSMMDIPFSGWLVDGPVRYMGKQSAFAVPLLGPLFRKLGGFEVKRDGTDMKALREAIEMLQGGEVLLVYPEGTRQHGAKIEALQPGAAYLALRARVPIVPVALAGTEEILRSHGTHVPRFGKVVAVIGEPIDPPELTTRAVPRAEVEALSVRLRDELQRLFDEANALRNGAAAAAG